MIYHWVLVRIMVLGWDVDLELSSLISELNSAIAFLSLKNAIALFSSEMSEDVSKSTSHPRTMIWAYDCWHLIYDTIFKDFYCKAFFNWALNDAKIYQYINIATCDWVDCALMGARQMHKRCTHNLRSEREKMISLLNWNQRTCTPCQPAQRMGLYHELWMLFPLMYLFHTSHGKSDSCHSQTAPYSGPCSFWYPAPSTHSSHMQAR